MQSVGELPGLRAEQRVKGALKVKKVSAAKLSDLELFSKNVN